jgi:transcriptional regulator with XRE-family HTH domain
MTSIEQALGQFIDDWNAGRRPDLDACLERVPEADRAQLAALLSTWLDVAPVPAYSDETLAEIAAEPKLQAAIAAGAAAIAPWGARLRRARASAGLAIGEVARQLAETFQLAEPAQAQRTAEYLERLEDEQLDARRLSGRLLDALASILGIDRDRLAPEALPMPPLGAAPAAGGGKLFRAEQDRAEWIADDIDALSQAAMAPAPPPMDEVDRLFLGGPEG